MPNTLRRIAPALLVLAPLIFGCETLAAQQTLTQAPAPPPAVSESAPAAGETRTTAKSDADAPDDAAATPALKLPARNVLASAEVKAAPAGFEKAFGYHAPPLTNWETPRDSKRPGRARSQGGAAGGQNDPAQTNKLTPLTPGEKMERAFRNAFLSPAPYAFSAVSAVLTQAGEDELPDKDFEDEFGDWASRFARTFANRTSRSILSNGVYASLFKQDPRYQRPRHKSFGGRVAYAVSRVFVTRDDDGNLEPNYSRFAGSLTASALANVYERSTPGHDRKGADATFRRFGVSFAYDALSNVLFREIVPTIFGR